ncbi:hypothetical protein ACJMK2_043646 [Sinanodonta woodiana]|uniref:Major facilitator superfamily (MFS) profile domain-containing protein n=1 Tax=Sinanodonta woodiana TaxID=1069815 RepID=A0ABD3VYC6_SINWO
MSEYEDILRQIGSFGPYQRRAFIFVNMFETPLAWAMLAPILLNAKVDWFCPDWSQVYVNYTDSSGNLSTLSINSWDEYDLYHHILGNGTNIPVPSLLNYCPENNTVCPGIKFDSKDGLSSIVTQWSLVCGNAYVTELITSIQMGGVLLGALLTGQLADQFGRRQILFIEHAMLVIVWFCSAFAGDWYTYAVLRFIIGGLIGGVLVVNFVLPLELVTPEWRTFCGCIGLWAVGLMFMSLWGYFIRDWQYLVIATSTASTFILLSWWFVPESPRWLLSRGRIKKAVKILTTMAKYNKKPIPDFSRLRQFAEKEKKLREGRRKYSYWHLCRTPVATKNTLILMYGWFVASCVYYGLNFNTKNLTGNFYLNIFLSGLVEIPALFFVVLVHNRLGRRLTVSMLMLISGVFCFSILIIEQVTGKSDAMPWLTVTLAMIGKAGISGGWAALQVFSAEIFPTVIRNIGVGSCSFSARIGGIVAPQFVLLGETIASPLPFTIFGCAAIVAGFLVWFLPETKGKSLPDTLEIEVVNPPTANNSNVSNGMEEAVSLQTLTLGNTDYSVNAESNTVQK